MDKPRFAADKDLNRRTATTPTTNRTGILCTGGRYWRWRHRVHAWLRSHRHPVSQCADANALTLMVLWEEYRELHPEGYGYSRFCDLAREFEARLSPVMRQHHVAGDKIFVGYSGEKIGIVDRQTGVVRDAEIFVAVLGASSLTYAEATWTQALADWIGAHVRMFRFYGGAARLLVPDNLKSGVHKASFYDPEINRSYGMMASHYGVGILPARPYRPRDKAKVEAGVRFAQTYILGRLRRQAFFSLAEANQEIAGALDRMNAHVMRRLGVSRRQLF